jgi:hypothetical protein
MKPENTDIYRCVQVERYADGRTFEVVVGPYPTTQWLKGSTGARGRVVSRRIQRLEAKLSYDYDDNGFAAGLEWVDVDG